MGFKVKKRPSPMQSFMAGLAKGTAAGSKKAIEDMMLRSLEAKQQQVEEKKAFVSDFEKSLNNIENKSKRAKGRWLLNRYNAGVGDYESLTTFTGSLTPSDYEEPVSLEKDKDVFKAEHGAEAKAGLSKEMPMTYEGQEYTLPKSRKPTEKMVEDREAAAERKGDKFDKIYKEGNKIIGATYEGEAEVIYESDKLTGAKKAVFDTQMKRYTNLYKLLDAAESDQFSNVDTIRMRAQINEIVDKLVEIDPYLDTLRIRDKPPAYTE